MKIVERKKLSNPAGVSLLLSKLLVDASAKAIAGQSSDGSFSWMDGVADELDGETLSDVMSKAANESDSIDWDTTAGGVRRASFDFDSENLLLYLFTESDFVLAAITPKSLSAVDVDRKVTAILPNLRDFL